MSRALTSSSALAFASLVVFGITGCNDFFTKDIELGTKSSTSSGGSGGGSGGGTNQADDDADGLSNAVEELFSMDPVNSDSDFDGVADGLEFVGENGDPLNGSAVPSDDNRSKILPDADVIQNEADRDRDGLGDGFETENGLSADDPDSDDDGYQDGLELVAGSNPFDSTSRPERDSPPASDGVTRTGNPPLDSDGDGISDAQENGQGLSTTAADTDGDGFGDGIELLVSSEANDAASVPNLTVPAAPVETATPEPTPEPIE